MKIEWGGVSWGGGGQETDPDIITSISGNQFIDQFLEFLSRTTLQTLTFFFFNLLRVLNFRLKENFTL